MNVFMKQRSARDISVAVADPTRIAILEILVGRSAMVSDMRAELGVSQPTFSHHLKVLVEHGFLISRRTGRHVTYEVKDPAVAEFVEALVNLRGAPPRRYEKTTPLRALRTCYDHLAG